MTVLATTAFPTFAVLIGILVNSHRLRAETFRMQQAVNARVKHLEEHLQR